MTTLYGIANCDKCRKARKWFEHHNIEIIFHDLRKDGLTAETVCRWLSAKQHDELLNRRSATWRALSATERARAEDDAIVQLLLDHPTLIKRPLVESGDTLIVGYDENAWCAMNGA